MGVVPSPLTAIAAVGTKAATPAAIPAHDDLQGCRSDGVARVASVARGRQTADASL
jgi:hypothetical protein